MGRHLNQTMPNKSKIPTHRRSKTPYLDSRDSLMKWVNFIHNRINLQLGKNELSLSEAVQEYYKHYLPRDLKREAERKRNEKISRKN